MNREQMYDLILGPVITEKSTQASEHNQVTFKVRQEATKPQVKGRSRACSGSRSRR